ncbi:hypothetical protein TNCT_667341 [Trichonephila clavata]|uniref:Uncharacterized protein n=1 Tax=Trichonephila clavata TaxID=2740835 RepID=A0A8X6KQV2_TRICU|nr:hypothetical protein TNCT_667341 [Trichonephila clavata]
MHALRSKHDPYWVVEGFRSEFWSDQPSVLMHMELSTRNPFVRSWRQVDEKIVPPWHDIHQAVDRIRRVLKAPTVCSDPHGKVQPRSVYPVLVSV